VPETEPYQGTQRWFGQAFDSPMYEGMPEVPTPVGKDCGFCDEPILEGEPGLTMPGLVKQGADWEPIQMAIHTECQIRSVLGGPSHLDGTCSCHSDCGPVENVVAGKTDREEAREVIARVWGPDWQTSAVRP